MSSSLVDNRIKSEKEAAHNTSLDDIASSYGKLVSSICHRMIMDEEVARDAAQQVWLEIVKSYPSFRGESKLSTWIYTITRRIASDYATNEKTYSMRIVRDYFNVENVDPPAHVDLEKEIWVKQMCDKCVTATLHCVDNEARLAHIFRDFAELEYVEIAQILEKDEAAVRQMVSRSRKRINSFAKDRCPVYNPKGACRCRITKHIRKVNLAAEYDKIDRITKRVNFFKQSCVTLPGKNYWENLL
jgi:RNA polymerase sigma factor (sigma-70 family)